MSSNVSSALPRFPEPPALIAEYIARRSTSLTDEPPPWDVGALPPDLQDVLIEWLDSVCRWLNETYAWQPHHVIPPCWTQHPQLVYEVAALAFARADAYDDPGSAILWHEQYERFLHRTNGALGEAGNDCRAGRHDRRPAHFYLQERPTVS